MLSQGRPTVECIREQGMAPGLSDKLFDYANQIKKSMDIVDDMHGIEKEEKKYSALKWTYDKINNECEEYFQLYRNMPYEVKEEMGDVVYSSDPNEPLSLTGLVEDLLKAQGPKDDHYYEYTSWLDDLYGGYNFSLRVLLDLVHVINDEMNATSSLISPFYYCTSVQKSQLNVMPEVSGMVENGMVENNGVGQAQEPSDAQNVQANENGNKARMGIVETLCEWAENGDWADGVNADAVKVMIRNVLGVGEANLKEIHKTMSEKLWYMLEHGRGDRLRSTWQNMVGYMFDKNILRIKSSPKINLDFFGDKKGSNNINKGRYGRLKEVTPLLDEYVPKIVKVKAV